MSYTAGIIGCGRIGCTLDDDPLRRGVWTHAGAYRACAATELVAAADVDATALARCGERWGVRRLYADYREMLARERLDIVSVCTPSHTHAAALRAALAAGVPAIWCEKPLAASVPEALDLVAECRGRVVAVNHVRRWDKAYETARAWLAAGRAREIRAASAWYTGGVSNIGSHLFDTLRFLLGEAAWVWAPPRDLQPGDPNVSGAIGFSSGVVCQILGCGPGDFLLFEIDLVGSDGRLRIGGNGTRVEAWDMGASARYLGSRELQESKVLWEGEDGERMVAALLDIVGCLEHGGEPRCTVRDGQKAVELVGAFLSSVDERRPIALPLAGNACDAPVPIR